LILLVPQEGIEPRRTHYECAGSDGNRNAGPVSITLP
jgi:hypothetical protein